MSIGWSFPPNNYGSENGLNDPGIETFLNRPLESLAREVIQNSRDAAVDPTKPVIVEFTLYDVPRTLFPGAKDFAKVLGACADYWADNVKTKKFFNNAKQLLTAENIPFLKISDYNTKGLTGATELRGRDWHKLTKSVGASDKHEGKDGSFGIGKHAPFACSAFRTVFYGTKAEDKTTAFQGVAKLVTHADKNGNSTQGTGYFGEKEKLQAILKLDTLDEFFRRRKFGTDIFIPGFMFEDHWEERVALSVIKNFFVSIHDGKLIVHVGEIRIDQTSLPELIQKLVAEKDTSGTTGFYGALVEENSHVFYDEDFLGMGRIELHVLVGENLPKQVAMVRQSGMLVYVKKRFKTPLRFAAVFIARGEKLNTFLTSLEPPAHDDWQPQRHAEDVPHARQVLQQMHAWITDRIKELSASSDAEQIDPEGLGQFLPDDLEQEDIQKESANVGEEKNRPREVEMQIRTVAPSAHSPSDNTHENSDEDNQSGESGSGNDPRNADGDGSGSGEPKQSQGGTSASSSLTKVNLRHFRLFCVDSTAGEYMLSYIPDMNGTGEIQLNIVGEVGNEAAPIDYAQDTSSGERYSVPKAGSIGPILFVEGQRRELKIMLKEDLRCAMEVSAHAG